jgi:hypothetical protein
MLKKIYMEAVCPPFGDFAAIKIRVGLKNNTGGKTS